MNLLNFINARQAKILLIMFLIPVLLSAQESITGKIKNKETGEAVQGAIINFDSTFTYVTSDFDGNFTISGLTKEKHSVTVTHISFKPFKTEVISGNKIMFDLIPKSYLSEDVNIVATRVDNNQAFAYTNVDKTEIEKQNLGKDLPFLLDMTPSVVVTSDGGAGVGYTGIRIRGSDATRVNVTINGIPVNDAESHQMYWVDLPDFASSVENLQIQRGIGSSTNGGGAFGGSINILSKKLSTDPFGEINSSAGSFNTFKNTVSFGSGLVSKSFAIEGRLSKISSDGYIDRASSDLQSFFLTGGYYGKTNSLRAVVFSGKEKTYQAWYGVPQDSLSTNRSYNPSGEYYDDFGNVHYYDNQTDNYQQDYYQLLYSHDFHKSLNGNLALHYTKGQGYYEEYKPDQNFIDYDLTPIKIGDSTIAEMDLIRQRWLSNDFYGFTWSLNYETKNLKINLGGAANRYTGKHFGEITASEIMAVQQYSFRYYEDNAEKSDANIFIRADYSFNDKVNLFADFQERSVEYSYDGLNDDFTNGRQHDKMNFFNPKGGVRFMASEKIQCYASVAVGHKEPVRDDFVNSTPSNWPDAESMTDYEGGARYNSGKLSLGINGYFMNYNNQLILTGRINDVGEYIRENVKNSYRSGVEVEGTYHVLSNLIFKANVTFSNNKIKSYIEYVDDYDGGSQVVNEYTNTPISFSPSIISAGSITFSPVKNFSIDLAGKYVGEQYLDNTGNESRKIDSYLINDLHMSYAIHPKKIKEVSFRISIYNFLNTEYISNGYSYSGYSGGMRYDYNYFFPQAKFNFMGGIVIKI